MEHGPRVYLGASNTFKHLLSTMSLNFNDYFVPYNFTISSIGSKSIWNFKYNELFWLIVRFIQFIFYKNYSLNISVESFAIKHNFSEQSKDYMDRLCRLTEGAGSDKYTLFEFFQMFNQNTLYQIYQPNKPNDIGLFKDIKTKLLKTKKITFLL